MYNRQLRHSFTKWSVSLILDSLLGWFFFSARLPMELFVIVSLNLFDFFFWLQFNQDLYSTSGVPLTSSSASVSSHSPCSPILPQSVALNATQTGGSTTIPTIPLGSLHRSIAKEEDLSSVTRQSDNDGKCISVFRVLPSKIYSHFAHRIRHAL